MLKQIDDEKIIPFRYVLADSVYGTNPEFIDTVENMVTERMAFLLHEPHVKSKVIQVKIWLSSSYPLQSLFLKVSKRLAVA
jgi:hypothetical protein